MESCDGSFKPLISGCTNMTVSRNDLLPIKDQNFNNPLYRSDLFNETSPRCKNASKLLSFPNQPLFVQWWHTHAGLITSIINEFFFDNLGMTSNLSHD